MPIVTRSSIPDVDKTKQNRGQRAQPLVGEGKSSGAGPDLNVDPQSKSGDAAAANVLPQGDAVDLPNQ